MRIESAKTNLSSSCYSRRMHDLPIQPRDCSSKSPAPLHQVKRITGDEQEDDLLIQPRGDSSKSPAPLHQFTGNIAQLPLVNGTESTASIRKILLSCYYGDKDKQEDDLQIQPRGDSSKSPGHLRKVKKRTRDEDEENEERSAYKLERAKRVKENCKFLFDCGLTSQILEEADARIVARKWLDSHLSESYNE